VVKSGSIASLVIAWIRRLRSSSQPARIGYSRSGDSTAPQSSSDRGEYQLLYKYLRDRYADRVVLAFGDIEDLVGFALPPPARVQPEWWVAAGPGERRSSQADAWMRANRTATVNLLTQNVVFDRVA